MAMAEEEELDYGPDALGDGDEEQQQECGSHSSAAAAASRGSATRAKPSHAESRATFTQRMQQAADEGLLWRDMRAAELAGYMRQDLEQRLATVQQRIDEAAASAAHFACGARGQLAVKSQRPVFLVTLYGIGIVQVPTLRCACRVCWLGWQAGNQRPVFLCWLSRKTCR